MKPLRERLWALLLALTLLAVCALPAAAEEAEPPGESPDVVETAAALADWLTAHKNIGGEVRFGATITLTTPIVIYGNTAPITVNTGGFGLVYAGGSLQVDALSLVGEGVDFPVLTVGSAYPASPFAPSWVTAVQPLFITATGREDKGGTALFLTADDGKTPDPAQFRSEGLIRAYGAGAVGLRLAAGTEACCLRVEVSGENSTAVLALQGAELRYCKLSAEGEGAAAARGAGVLLDTCALSPETAEDGVALVQRRIIDTAGQALYLPVPLHEAELDWLLGPYYSMTYLLSGPEEEAVSLSCVTEWETAKRELVDVTAPGRYLVPGVLPAPLQELGLEPDFPLVLTVEVRDPAIPCISALALASSADEGNFIRLHAWKSEAWAAEDIILWRSDDEGKSWRDASDDPALRLQSTEEAHVLLYAYEEITAPIHFQLEVLGFGESNVAIISNKDGHVRLDPGGDRSGTDRDGATKPNDPPPRDDDKPSGGYSSGGGKKNTPIATEKPVAPPEPLLSEEAPSAPAEPLLSEEAPPAPAEPVKGEALPEEDTSALPAPASGGDPPAQTKAVETGLPAPAGAAALLPAVPAQAAPDSVPPPAEYRTDRETVISGARLAGLLEANPDGVSFLLGTTRVVAESEALAALGLAENQIFAVRLEADGVTVSFWADDMEVALPHELYIAETEETAASAATRQAPALPAEEPQSSGVLWFGLAGLGALSAVGGVVLVKRRRSCT